MDALDLQTPLANAGLARVFFFNGRLLSAGDLRTEQDARRHADMWLGQGCGDGVVWGLEVEEASPPGAANPLLTVKAGLALNRAGMALKLECDVTVALASQPQTTGETGSGCFAACAPVGQGPVYRGSSGLYLLTIAPAERPDGKVPTSGLSSQGGACNTDVVLDTVMFRRISLDNEMGDLSRSDEQLLRSNVAWRSFGGDAQQAFAANPFGAPPAAVGLIDTLRASKALNDCDVPLAIVYWSSAGLRFVDLWSVRRTPTQRGNVDHPFGLWAGERLQHEGEARWLQFQGQLQQVEPQQRAGFSATGRLRFLPAAGLLPLADGGSGFAASPFFAGLDVGVPLHIDAAWLPALLRMSFQHPPIDLGRPQPLRLYLIHENVVARSLQQNPPPTLVFAGCSLPPLDNARFGYAQHGNDHFAATHF